MSTATQARERPILFSAPMVRAILDGRKTMTRRIIHDRYYPVLKSEYHHILRCDGRRWHYKCRVGLIPGTEEYEYEEWSSPIASCCPFGELGDRLWVREAWSPDHRAFYPHYPIVYRADGYPTVHDVERGMMFSDEAKENFPFRWRSSIFMPRSASRITLEITGVRVERLQEISGRDCVAEGIAPLGPEHHPKVLRDDFRRLWESIHGVGSWDLNPWLWCIEFRKVEP